MTTQFRCAVLASFLAVGSAAQADDTVRLLGGVGANQADTQQVCWWRPWRYDVAYAVPVAPPVVYAAPVCCAPTYVPPPALETGPPPAVGPASYYQPLPAAVAIAPRPRPTIVVGYQGRFFGGSIAIQPRDRLVVRAAPVQYPTDVMPTPRPNDGYRYDGGPTRPVPMPNADPLPATDPVPATVPALYRVMRQRSRSNVVFPAYGEKPGVPDPRFVRN